MRCIAVGATPSDELTAVAPALIPRLSPDIVEHVVGWLRRPQR
jgi:hypothetical protein